MLQVIGKRLLMLIPTLIGLSILLFVWVRNLPGGPATALLGDKATPDAVAAINALSPLRPMKSSAGAVSVTSARQADGTRFVILPNLTSQYHTARLAVPVRTVSYMYRAIVAATSSDMT